MCDSSACGRPKRKASQISTMKTSNSVFADMMGELQVAMLKPSKANKPRLKAVSALGGGEHAVVIHGSDLYDPNDYKGLHMDEGLHHKKMRGLPASLVLGSHLFNRPLLERADCLQVDEEGNCAQIASRMYAVLKKDAFAGQRYLKGVEAKVFSSKEWRLPNLDDIYDHAAAGSGAGGGSVTRGGVENVESGV